MDEWSGDGDRTDVRGPVLSIRHPRWTEQDHWQDIPIMVFTYPQWKLVDDGSVSVSAAPYGPGEIGRNRKYVFALPPRFLIDEDTGYREVIQIVKDHPLHAF